MPKSDGFFNVVFKKYRRSSILTAAAITPGLVLAATGSWAASRVEPAVNLLMTTPVPVAASNTTGGMYGFDISWVNQATQTYYLADRSNAAVDVVDGATGVFKKQITASPPFAGVKLNSTGTAANNNISGPDGVVTGAVNGGGTCLFAGDGPSRLVSFSLPSGAQVSDISTGGTTRVDEMAYDPKDQLLVAANNAETPPFATLFSVGRNCAVQIKTRIVFGFATNGAEQSVWDPATGLFYMSIPQITPTVQHGLVIGIDTTGKIVKRFRIELCQPAGLTLNPNTGELLLGCSVVFDTAGAPWSGTDIHTAAPQQIILNPRTGVGVNVFGVGTSDEVTYNARDNHFYTGSSSSPYVPHDVTGATLTAQGANILGVIDGTSLGVDQLVPTFGTPNVLVNGVLAKPSGSGHSVAANDTNGWVFVPAPANNVVPGCLTGCIQVFARRDRDTD